MESGNSEFENLEFENSEMNIDNVFELYASRCKRKVDKGNFVCVQCYQLKWLIQIKIHHGYQ